MWRINVCWPNYNFPIYGFSFHSTHTKQHRIFGDTKVTDVLLLALFKSFLLRLSPFASSKQLHNNEFPLCSSNIAIFSPKRCETGQCAELLASRCYLGGKNVYCEVFRWQKEKSTPAACVCKQLEDTHLLPPQWSVTEELPLNS